MKRIVSALLVLCLSVCVGCSRAAWQAASQRAAAGAAGAAPLPAALLFYGGRGHKTFLGCLKRSEYSQSSIHNSFSFGSPYGQTIFNHYSEYGSTYSSESACNPYATDPPVIVDSNGNYYGRLTLNEYHYQIGVGRDFVYWLRDKVCN